MSYANLPRKVDTRDELDTRRATYHLATDGSLSVEQYVKDARGIWVHRRVILNQPEADLLREMLNGR